MDLDKEEIRRIAGMIPGETSVYELVDGRLESLYFSEGIPALSDMERDEYARAIARDASDVIAEPDKALVAGKIGEALATGGSADVTYRIVNKHSGYIWVHAKSNQIGEMNGHPVLLVAFLDTSHETELHEDLLDRVAECVHVCDAKTHELLYINKIERDSWHCTGSFEGMTCHAYLHNRKEVCPWCGLPRKGADDAHFDEMYDPDVNRYFRYDRQKVSWHGRDAFAVFAIDITARKLEEIRYRHVVGELLSANPQALCAFELNLTQNTCDEGRGTSDYVQSALASSTADGVFHNLSKLIVDRNGGKTLPKAFDRQSLIDAFGQGKDRFSIEYQRKGEEGSVIWAQTFVSMVRNPTTDDIEAVIYSEDVDDRVHRAQALRLVTENSYDYIALIDVDNGTLSFQDMGAQVPDRYRDDYRHNLIPGDYGNACAYTADTWVYPDDREVFLTSSSIGSIVEHLRQTNHFEFSIRGRRENGDVRRKRINYTYLDGTKRKVVVWQVDVTDAFEKEQQDAQRLQVALAAAKQASNAKTVFLSRMSHEIRTPMNAIIGMDALAAQAIGDDERVSDCLSKIGISSRYLLSLINDILDMSRIESGKMLLKNESFYVHDLVTGVDDLIVGQAEAKGLDFDCIVGSEVVDAYIGDAMKIQQILINVLGNAVKFTDKGKIILNIQQVSRRGDDAKIRFVASDTGKGIPERDQERIFEPFEQGDTSTTSVFGGTGLGLAITKNLVDLMGGTIRLRSIEGVGSEFTIEIPLTIDRKVVGAPKQTYHFEKMSTLVVDDDLVVCEQSQFILKEIGMTGEWVTSGAEAVEKVRTITAKKGRYDFILIDWKMPDMDGIETTRQIRKIVGPDVTIIIISSYDWQSIELEARAAGANLLVSKPLFKSTLVSAFQKAQSHVEEKRAEKVEYDFTGKRVLLAEDNAMNAEIAECLLENEGFSVELAHDGLEALEMFTQGEPGYYDAILMDVRMPHMDGLQATSTIRRWKKADAKTIPIVAMTANAFDEDVEKSKAAGMNAHLAKPIEPEVMFRTLYRLIEDREG